MKTIIRLLFFAWWIRYPFGPFVVLFFLFLFLMHSFFATLPYALVILGLYLYAKDD